MTRTLPLWGILLLFAFPLLGQTTEEIEKQIDEAFAKDTTKQTVMPTGASAVSDLSDTTIIEFIPIVTLNDADLANDQDEGVFGLLSASKDIFVRITDFNLSAARFRFRGYDSENVALYFNNLPMNDLESGWAGWSSWSGLNDMTRRQETNTGLEATGYTFGALGGSINIDSRASSQRKQTRLTLTRTNNGNYNNRIMLSHATGMQDNGWAYAASVSRRWAQEAYIPGTFHEGYSYFLAVDKQMTDKDLLSLQVLGAYTERGKSGAAVQDLYDLTDDNYYNPYWGYQNGEKRNSRIARRHQPMVLLRWDKEFNENLSLTTAVNYQTGRNGSTSLDWTDAPDPRSDYYHYIPYFVTLDDEARLDERLRLEDILASNEGLRQIQWDRFYDANKHNPYTIEDANGIQGNTISGNRAHFMVLERRYDSDRINFNTNLTAVLNTNWTLTSGIGFQDYRIENYQLVDDLLGSDFHLDIDRFAIRDFDADPTDAVVQSDLNNPNRAVTEGDRFGYDYDSNIQKANAWVQGEYSNKGWSAFAAANVIGTQFWRTGHYRNGLFPDNSLGDSEKQQFLNYNVKGGLTYAIDGRNYLFVNAAYMTRAPFFRNAYESPRTRQTLVEGLTDEKIFSVEGAYILNAPNASAKLGAYYTTFDDQTDILRFYNDLSNAFGSYIMTNVDKRHTGVEAAFRVNVPFVSGLTVQGAGTVAQYLFTSRFNASAVEDNNGQYLFKDETIYSKNFFVSGRPQTAGSIGLEYRTSNYLTFNIDLNYFDNIYMDFNPERRRTTALYESPTSAGGYGGNFSNHVYDNSDPRWSEIIDQLKEGDEYTVNVTVRKSFKVKNDYFINVILGVDNLLNNTTFIRDGYEQLRYDYDNRTTDRFPPRYFYARGITYFVNVAFSIR